VVFRGLVARLLAIVGLFLAFTPGPVDAQAWPSRPVRLVVPYPAGGPTDILGRVIAQKLTESLGQPVTVDNRPGASGNLGSDLVAKAAPDGYTLVLGNNATHATNESLFPNMPYQTLRDFAPIALVATVTNMVTVHPSVPARSVAELVAHAKANPGKLNYGSTGNGSAAHLIGELFKTAAGVDIVHVPYRGSAPAVTDLLAGQVQMMFATLPTVLPHVQDNKLRGLAITAASRLASQPAVPTLGESGFSGLVADAWFGLLAPVGTPADIINRLAQDTIKGVQAEDARRTLAAQGFEVTTSGAPQFAEHIRGEIAKWAKVIRDSGAKVD
jgi:tripartite-type tricarboxylate transporter receptor subunit TctC